MSFCETLMFGLPKKHFPAHFKLRVSSSLLVVLHTSCGSHAAPFSTKDIAKWCDEIAMPRAA
jgi:hypothetical protein